MARVNHNAQYIYDVDGETVWEKLRVIRGMLQDRKISLALARLKQQRSEATLDPDSWEYKEYLILRDQTQDLIQDCENEIEFLTEFEKALATEAEKTRIAGKTDDEMYEINFFDELKMRLVRSAEAQILANGRMQEDTIKRILKNRPALQICIDKGLLDANALQISADNRLPGPAQYEILHLENLKRTHD